MTHSFAISMPIGAWHPFLPSALESLKAQDVPLNVAFLDASGDPRVKAFADENDDWLAYRRHGPDNGQSDAIIEGWENTQSEWLGWLNADDILMPGALEAVVSQLTEKPETDIIYGHSSIIDESGAMTGYHFSVEPPGPRLLESGIVSQPSCFFRREAYENVGGLNRDLHYVMDWDLWIRLYKDGAKFQFIDDVLSMVLWAADTKTASWNDARRKEIKTLISEHAPEEMQKKIFRSFSVAALTDKVPNAFRQHATNYVRRRGQVIRGVRSDGAIMGTAELIHVHYLQTPATGVELRFDAPVERSSVRSDRSAGVTIIEPGRIELHFAEPLPAGEICRVAVDAPNNGTVRLQTLSWLT